MQFPPRVPLVPAIFVVVVVAIFEIVGRGKGEELVLLYWNFLFKDSFQFQKD